MVTGATAARIVALHAYSISNVFFEILIETRHGDEREVFNHLEHTGRQTGRCYVVKRRIN